MRVSVCLICWNFLTSIIFRQFGVARIYEIKYFREANYSFDVDAYTGAKVNEVQCCTENKQVDLQLNCLCKPRLNFGKF
jgi:hypothetical protein